MKKIFATVLLLTALFTFGQERQFVSNQTYLKANALFLPIGIINVGIETQITPKITIETDAFVSPWKSFAGKHLQAYMLGVDGRYYFKEAFKHWYFGANFTFALYNLQKWNYWKEVPYQHDEEAPIYTASNLYQKGYSFMFGAVVGYQFQLNDRWNMDVFIGGGNSQDFYRGYDKVSGDRYDDPQLNRRWNKSGEWIVYKGGVMVSYRIK